MKYYTFNYMKGFKCLGGECKHNCCLNWQIDIDTVTLKKYLALGKNDKRFLDNIDYSSKQFIKNEKGRCPFLNDKNLCDIIVDYGEKELCKTCKTHPRFINFFNGFNEVGATLGCEFACKLILTCQDKMYLVKGDNLGVVKEDKEIPYTIQIKQNEKTTTFQKELLKARSGLIKLAQAKKLTVANRMSEILATSKVDLPHLSIKEWVNFYKGLEILDKEVYKIYDEILNVKGELDFYGSSLTDENFSTAYENLLSYFIFRNVPRAFDQVDLMLFTAFSVLNVIMIATIFDNGKDKSLNGLIEACRLYSTEIEYSDNNIESILTKLESLIRFC